MKQREIPVIRLEDPYQIRLLVCFILNSVGCPLTEKQLIEITTENDMVNYFDLIQALNGIENNGLCTVCVDGTLTSYAIAENGKKALLSYESHIPLSIRERCVKNAVDLLNREQYKTKYESKIIVLEKGYYLRLKYTHPIFNAERMELKLFFEDYAEAMRLQGSVDDNPKEILHIVEDYFRKSKNSAGE